MQYSETAIWKPVVGYEGLYEVSSDGQVRSLSRVVTTNRIVKVKLQSFTWTSQRSKFTHGFHFNKI